MLRDKERRAIALAQEMEERNSQPQEGDIDPVVDDMETYFTYRPLSNLPTPPPSSRESSAAQSPIFFLPDEEEDVSPKYKGSAVHLVNLIPSSASLVSASIPLVQTILTRSRLPLETVALAVCILDSLDSRFARKWRLACPLVSGKSSSSSASSDKRRARHSLPPTPASTPRQQFHIDSVSPEIMILAALVIAAKFTEDPQELTQFYCHRWGKDIWSHEQLNATERCMMETLGYRIMPLYQEEYLTVAMMDMQVAGQQYEAQLQRQQRQRQQRQQQQQQAAANSLFVPSHNRAKTVAMSSIASIGLGLGLTPDESSRA